MSLYPYTITAIAKNTTAGSNIVAGAVISLLNSIGSPVTMYDNAAGSNGSTGKTADSRGQVTVYVEQGEYSLNVNGTTNGKFTVISNLSTINVDTFANLELLTSTTTGQAFICQERANAPYILKASSYVALAGDATFANGRVAALQYTTWVNAAWFGELVGDGTVVDGTVLQAAISRGINVIIPKPATRYKITSGLNLAANNQRITCIGKGEIRQATALENVFNASGKSGCTVENVHIYCSGSKGSLGQGAGVAFVNCDNMIVINNTVENNRGQGVYFDSSNNGTVRENTFINSPVTDGTGNTNTGADIRFSGGSSNNLATGNICKSGNAGGIYVQTVASGDDALNNKIIGNHILNPKSYGVMVYRNDDLATPQSSNGAIVSGNTILNVTGTILNEATNSYTFGSGIYLQGSEGSIVTGNYIDGTHTGSVTHVETLAPGAIGATNLSRATITGNTILNAGFDGIHINDPNDLGVNDGKTIVSNNNITTVAKRGIRIKDRSDIIITSNTLDAITEVAILCDTTSGTSKNLTITENILTNMSSGGVVSINTDNVNVSLNTIIDSTNDGINVSSGSTFNINGNITKGATSGRGIRVQSTALDATVTSNTSTGNQRGIVLDAPAIVYGNLVSGNSTADYEGLITTLDDSGTPSVKYMENFITSGTTAITNFDDGISTQTITILAQHSVTITDNSNIVLAGGANFDMTSGDVLVLKLMVFNDWFEISRSVN